jgi:Putative peptidoglycan binding domain
MATALDVVNTAQLQVGYIEGENNDTIYGEWYGLNHEPYCAIGVSWVFAQNNLSHLVAAQTTKGFSYCPAGMAWFQQKGCVVDKYAGKTGDLIFYSFSGNGLADHVEILVAASKDGITTVGFNTSPDHALTASQANGNGVYLRHRPYLHVLAIVRPQYEVSTKPTQSLGTNKMVAGGVAAATALGGGGVAATHQNKPAYVAPAWSANAFPIKKKTPQELAVEKALYKIGLLPKVAIDSAWGSIHINAVKTFQKSQQSPQTGIVDKSTYTALIKELP